MKHWHHIVPRHMGGSDDPSNLIELSVEDHALAHKKLWEDHGRWQDFVAWQGLSGRMTCEETIKAAQKSFFTEDKRREWSERMRKNRKSGRVVNKANVNAKSYKIMTPSGETMIVINLTKWSQSVGLNHGSVKAVAEGKRASIYGYRIEAA